MITLAAMRLFLVLVVLIQGCVFVPRTTTAHDERCNTQTRHLTLGLETAGNLGGCSGKECAALLAAIGAVAMASLVVSGSIVMVGNTVFWLEKQGHCYVG